MTWTRAALATGAEQTSHANASESCSPKSPAGQLLPFCSKKIGTLDPATRSWSLPHTLERRSAIWAHALVKTPTLWWASPALHPIKALRLNKSAKPKPCKCSRRRRADLLNGHGGCGAPQLTPSLSLLVQRKVTFDAQLLQRDHLRRGE